MSANSYQIAYEHVANEIAEIDAQIQRLTRRKELLEALLQPLELLLSESGSVAIPATLSDGLNTEFAEPEAAEQGSPVVMVGVLEAEPGPLEDPALMAQSAVEETNVDARSNGRSIPHEDIAELAYRLWNERGQAHGYHEEDWFRAAHELHNSAY